jgi:hypothetical protein
MRAGTRQTFPPGWPTKRYDTSSLFIPLGDSPISGPPSAPLTLVVFTDLGSEDARKAANIVRNLLGRFEGELRVVWKHGAAEPAATAGILYPALAQARQRGKGWDLYDAILSLHEPLTPSRLAALLREQEAPTVAAS